MSKAEKAAPTLTISINETHEGKYYGHVVLMFPDGVKGIDAKSTEVETRDEVRYECEHLVSIIRLKITQEHGDLNIVWE